MGARAAQEQFLSGDFVDQQPIRLHMAVPRAVPIARQCMVPALRRQAFLSHEESAHFLELLEVFAPFLLSIDVLLELAGLSEPHESQEA